MKLRRPFKIVTVAGVYFPAGALGGFVEAPGVAFYRDGSRRWDGPSVRRTEKRGRRAHAYRLALREANA